LRPTASLANIFIRAPKFMKQFSLENQELILKVKKSPPAIRAALFIITFLCFALPLLGILFNIIAGDGVKFGGVLALGIFSLLGFHLLRLSLWNHQGREKIQFSNAHITYLADYGWFVDGKKEIDNYEVLFLIKSVGYEEENKGVLIISNKQSEIESVVTMPKYELDELIERAQNLCEPSSTAINGFPIK